MPRRKMYCNWQVPSTVVDTVKAICADYDRRKRILKDGTAPSMVQEMYERLNTAVDNALETLDAGVRRDMLQDIGRKRGYEVSDLAAFMAKNTYYNYRRKVIYEIAKGLSLI